ncbi:MAG: hypothetical protein WStaPseu_19290 [Shewanella algae]|uniref:Uncharacterized protein n=1 Tax=Shewanella algae TaxID=38313 RepID=A0AAD1NN19_9GAMM|nr:hypothetical protein TUM17379_10900 [Shewanella algae]
MGLVQALAAGGKYTGTQFYHYPAVACVTQVHHLYLLKKVGDKSYTQSAAGFLAAVGLQVDKIVIYCGISYKKGHTKYDPQ